MAKKLWHDDMDARVTVGLPVGEDVVLLRLGLRNGAVVDVVALGALPRAEAERLGWLFRPHEEYFLTKYALAKDFATATLAAISPR